MELSLALKTPSSVPTFTIAETSSLLIENKEHISVIQDDYGCMRGIVTMEDVIETMLGVEIVDENDKAIDMQEFAKKTSESYRKTARIIKGEK